MKNIKEIVAENLVSLRKQNGLTQEDVAKKLNYSDNTVSRWERAEVSPSLETLNDIATLFNVPVDFLVKENVVKRVENNLRTKKFKALVFSMCVVSFVWLCFITAFFCFKQLSNHVFWTFFVWPVPISCLILFVFAFRWRRRTLGFIMFTIAIWTTLASFYLQFLSQNIWMVFLFGLPLQVAWTIWCYVRPHRNRKKSVKE